LNACHLINRFNPFSLFGSLLCFLLDLIDIGNFALKLFINFRRQPVTNQVWFEIAFFLKASPHVGGRCWKGYAV